MTSTYVVPVPPPDQARVSLVVRMMAVAFGVAPEDVMAGGRSGSLALSAKRAGIYLAHVGFGWPLERAGHGFRVNRTTAGVACRWVEDRRDDPALDDMLTRHERALNDICGSGDGARA